jgi:hypothetical protein
MEISKFEILFQFDMTGKNTFGHKIQSVGSSVESKGGNRNLVTGRGLNLQYIQDSLKFSS